MIDSFMRTYEGTDWKSVLQKALNADYAQFGDMSMLNNCVIGNMGDLTRMPHSEQGEFLEDKLIKCNVGQGGIIKVKQLGYMVCFTELVDNANIPGDASWWLSYGKIAEAVLISEYSGQWQAIACGSLEDMKRKAHAHLRKTKYAFDCYIVTRTNNYKCYGNVKRQKSTARETDNKYLVVPYYEFKILGRVNI